ncbi:MAG: hypothetical protein KDI10_04550 [Halioglobus sp.]|nr:hypothetical protein [Halioglobus sp.]MCP5122014.1 hypothetical protein [Pseudomonadales bacterium]
MCRPQIRRGGIALPVVCDVKAPDSLAQCVAAVVDHFGGLNILANTAREVPLAAIRGARACFAPPRLAPGRQQPSKFVSNQ